ncbi:MAG: hypothetical protein ACRD2Z_06485 [Thermoanaerobaculia bacterium]
MSRCAGFLLLLLVATPVMVGAQEASDAELVERVLAETRVEERPARPSLGDYLRHVFVSSLATPTARSSVGLLERVLGIGLRVLAGLAGVAVLWLLWIVLRSRRGRAPAPAADPAWVIDVPAVAAKSAAEWRDEIEACLAAADLAGALKASWWWIATIAAEEDAQSSWTTDDAARFARHPGVRALLCRLDRMAFGLVRPDGEQIRSILNDAGRLFA